MSHTLDETALPLTDDQREAWLSAQDLWGVSLHDALSHPHADQGSFAWFSFPPQVWFDLEDESAVGVEHCLESIFAHEIGHHVLSPSTRQDDLKIRHQMARALTATGVRPPSMTERAAWFSNVWSDMLINVRVAELQRVRGAGSEPEMITMWRILASKAPPSRPWWVVLRAYEIVWSRPPGTLCPGPPPAAPTAERTPQENAEQRRLRARELASFTKNDPGRDAKIAELEKARVEREALQTQLSSLAVTDPELDASLLADAIRTFAADPISGALRFGMIIAPYFLEQQRASGEGSGADEVDVVCGGQLGGRPATPGELVAVLADARLREVPVHPATIGADGDPSSLQPSEAAGQGYGTAATLELYAGSAEAAVLSAWYQAQARPWVRPLVQPSTELVLSDDVIPGALEEWSLGDEIGDIDWSATLARSTTVVPGVTTRQRDSLPDAPPPRRESIQLDLYIDSSGSMPSPQQESPAVLAGTILMLGVLRGGGRIRVTSFSAAGQVAGMERFTRDRTEAFSALTTYFGGGTTFPLDLFGARYRGPRRGADVRRHVVVLSDDGLLSLFGAGQPQYAHVAADVRKRLDSATLIVQDHSRSVASPAAENGYDVLFIDRMTDAPKACADLAQRLAAFHG